jgi:hypothetical protein
MDLDPPKRSRDKSAHEQGEEAVRAHARTGVAALVVLTMRAEAWGTDVSQFKRTRAPRFRLAGTFTLPISRHALAR